MSEFRVKGWHVLVVVLAFFGVTIGVNATFVTLALATFSGEVSEEPYVQGLDYNDTLAARAVQAERGWTAALDVTREPGGGARLVLEVRDARDAAVSGLDVRGEIGRPATSSLDQAFAFSEADGIYTAVLEDLPDGEWELMARTSFYDGAPFEARRRVWLR